MPPSKFADAPSSLPHSSNRLKANSNLDRPASARPAITRSNVLQLHKKSHLTKVPLECTLASGTRTHSSPKVLASRREGFNARSAQRDSGIDAGNDECVAGELRDECPRLTNGRRLNM